MRIPLPLLLLVAAACAPSDGMRFQVINMERPPEDYGLAPPTDEDYKPCYQGEARGFDTNGDGKIDRIQVRVDGKARCYGEDTNHDGRVDTWDIVDKNGQITRRAHDSDGDRRIDQSWTFDPTGHGCATLALDRDGDGLIDPGDPIHLCKDLAAGPHLTPVSATDAGR